MKNILSPLYIVDFFKLNNSSYPLKNSDFIIPRFNSVANGKHSPRYLEPVIWAKLDSYIRSSETLSTFIKRIKRLTIKSLIGKDSSCDICNFVKTSAGFFHIFLSLVVIR